MVADFTHERSGGELSETCVECDRVCDFSQNVGSVFKQRATKLFKESNQSFRLSFAHCADVFFIPYNIRASISFNGHTVYSDSLIFIYAKRMGTL